MGRILVIDGHAYAYRSFHAIRRLNSPQGRPTNAIFGFIKTLDKLREQLAPQHLIVVWDGGLSAERVASWPAYKAQRPAMPDALAEQLDGMAQYLQAAGIASYCGDGVEADDYIACLARHAAERGFGVVIASSDKDFMQLVSPAVCLVNPNEKHETLWTETQVRQKSGVGPPQIVDWLSLIGDSVDNIPGVSGVGPKTAAELLNRFGSIETLYQRLPEVALGRLRASLQSAELAVRRNQRLIRLRDDLACGFDLSELAVKPGDPAQLLQLYREWGFRGMAAALESVPEQGILFGGG